MTAFVAGRPWLCPLDLDPELDRDAWVAARVAGIGGSDVPAVVNEHPQKSAVDVWLERTTGGVSAFTDNGRTVVGRLLEPVVIGWFQAGGEAWPRAGGELVIAKPPTVYHRDRPWQRGSADGLIYDPEVVQAIGPGVDLVRSAARPSAMVEVKTHGWFASRSYETTDDGAPIDVPPDKRIQCAWYMELYDVPICYLLALVDTHVRKTYVIQRDRELGASLLFEVERFWRDHVLTGIAPPPDGSEHYSAYLKARFKKHRAELLASTPEVDAAAKRLIRIKRLEKKLEPERERLEQVIQRHIGDAQGVTTAIGPITWKSQRSGRLREKDARAELYSVAGWTDDEIRAFETKHATPDHRVMRTPK